MFKIILIAFVLFFTPVHAHYGRDYLDSINFKIAIYGPADDLARWWGHVAVVVEDKRTGFERSFDWGDYYYPSRFFLKDFLRKRVRRFVSSSEHDIAGYMWQDRDIVVYNLNLDRQSKEIMLSYLEKVILPENRYHPYHNFRENCATGVRDAIDLAIGGQFKAAFGNVPGRFTHRQHMMRYTLFRPLSEWLLNFLLGPDIDEKITVWDEMFLPVEIARNIVDFKYIDNYGEERNLVSSVQIIYSSKNRFPILNNPINTMPLSLAAGLFFMALIFWVDGMRKKYPTSGRIILGLFQSALGLLLGIFSSILTIGLLMGIVYPQQNINIWFVNPLLFVVVPLGFLLTINKSFFINTEKLLRAIWTYVFIAGCITLLLRILPSFYQQNLSICALILPVAFALSYVPEKLYKLTKR